MLQPPRTVMLNTPICVPQIPGPRRRGVETSGPHASTSEAPMFSDSEKSARQ